MFLGALLLFAGACAHDRGASAETDTLPPAMPPPALVVDAPASTPADESKPSICTEPRPQMCTMDYRPVCATRDTGVRCIKAPCPSSEQKTYSNGCSACSDATVSEYVEGECPALPPADGAAGGRASPQ
jgi:hypothetical protein